MFRLQEKINYLKKFSNLAAPEVFANLPNVAFVHVPKCGGTSVRNAVMNSIYSVFDSEWEKLDKPGALRAGRALNCDMHDIRTALFAYLLASKKSKFISGHYYAPPALVNEFIQEWSFITILRHPVERWISEYIANRFNENYWGGVSLEFDDYVKTDAARFAATSFIRYFSNNDGSRNLSDIDIVDARSNLERFHVVGCVSESSQWESNFSKHFGKKISLKKLNSKPFNKYDAFFKDMSKRKIVAELCKEDIEVYEQIKKLRFPA